MAAYTDLTAAQQAWLQSEVNTWRSNISQIYALFSKIANTRSAWNASIGAMVTSLDPNTVIPNTSGFAGAGPVTRESMIASIADISNALDSFNEPHHREFAAALVGSGNIG
jgi:hypothetical protein